MEVEELGYPQPLGGLPVALELTPLSTVAAYTRRDGAAHIALDPVSLVRTGPYVESVAAHELFHALQDACDAPYGTLAGEPGAWWWEATATWMETEVVPDGWFADEQLHAFALRPHLGLAHVDPEDPMDARRPYGAFVFPLYLAEFVGGPELIRASWLEARDSDPLEVLERQLGAAGHPPLSEVVPAFAAQNVTWDYARGDYMQAAMAPWTVDRRREAAVLEAPSATWIDGPDVARFGTVYLRVTPAAAAEGVRVQLGRPDDWRFDAVALADGARLPLAPTADGVTLQPLAVVRDVWVVATAVVDHPSQWRYAVGGAAGPPLPFGTGCRTIEAPTGVWWVVLVLGIRRRR